MLTFILRRRYRALAKREYERCDMYATRISSLQLRGLTNSLAYRQLTDTLKISRTRAKYFWGEYRFYCGYRRPDSSKNQAR